MRFKAMLIVVLGALALSLCAGAADKPADAKDAGKSKMKKWEDMTPEERKKLQKHGEEFRDNMVKFINDRLKHRFVPSVVSAAVSPASPAKGKPIKITVKLKRDPKAIDPVEAVEVFYTEPGGEYFDLQAELKGSGDNWTGTLPAFKKTGKVKYYIQARDAFGGLYSDLPCQVTQWPPVDDPCMITGAPDPEPVDDPKIKIGDDYDIWEVRIGQNGDSWHLQQNVQGKIYKGKLSPLKASMYTAMVVNSEMIADVDDIGMFFGEDEKAQKAREANEGKSAFFGYTPIGPAIDPNFPACWMGMGKRDQKKEEYTSNIECKKEDQDLFFRIKKKALGNKLKNDLTFIGAMTGFVDNIQIPFPKIMEFANFTRVVMVQRSFEVK